MLEDDRIFEPGSRLILTSPAERTVEVEFFRRQHGHCVIKFRGIDTISEAQLYVGSEIRIPASELTAPQEGWFFTFQLKGCSVFAVNGEYLGIVTDVLDLGGAEILKVDRDNHETLIPFAISYVKKIDVHQHRIEVDLPEGLRDLNK